MNPIKNYSHPNPILLHSPTSALSRRQIPVRPGLIALKKGMTGIWDEKGVKIPVTVLQVDRAQILGHKTVGRNGYHATLVGGGLRQPRNCRRSELGQFALSGVFPKQKVREFRTLEQSTLEIGTELKPSHFKVGQEIDIRSRSKGKGFAGVMKRHGFKGLRASHGVSISHRSAGSMGQSQDPGRVLPGKKMAGRLGGQRVTVQNVRVVEVDDELGTIMVKGPVPGPKDGWVELQDAMKA